MVPRIQARIGLATDSATEIKPPFPRPPPHPQYTHAYALTQAWLHYQHARHLSTFHDLHAVMAFAAMANGVEDDAEAELWQTRTRDFLRSMEEYVRSGGQTSSRPATPPPPPAAAAATTAVQLHSFPVGQSRSAAQSGAFSAAGGADEGPRSGEGGGPPPDNLWVAEHVGLPLCEAMVAYRGVSKKVA